MSRSVYLAFATGPQDGRAAFLDRVAEANAASTLLVAARDRPHRGEWIEVRAGQGTGAIIAACRRTIQGRDVAGVAIHATRQGGEWRMRLAALTLAGLGLRIYNDNLDHFPASSFATLWQHLNWRWRQRSKGALWWNALAQLAILCARRRTRGTPPAAKSSFPPADLTPGISVVIPSRNGREFLAAMLPGVIADLQSHTSELIVVDNGSTDSTPTYLHDHFPQICLEFSAASLSFSAAVNRGIRVARYAHVVLLNNDMQIERGFFAALRSAFDRTPDLFCATAQIFFPSGQRREETGLCFWRRDPGDDFPVYCAEPEPGEDQTHVLYGSGGCSMYDALKLRELGGFDEVYQPAYVEDLDVGYRAWQQGWPTVFCANAKVEHRHRATTSKYYQPEFLNYLVERNYLRFLVRATGEIFPDLWRDAIRRLKNRAKAGDQAAGRALRTAWREVLGRKVDPGTPGECARKQMLTK